MRALIRLACALWASCAAAGYELAATEDVAAHRAAAYEAARDFIVETFNLAPVSESVFEARRFNSMGVWGDFEARLKELGADRFEVQGWLVSTGHFGRQLKWSVVIEYPMPDPQAWKRQRLDEPIVPSPPQALYWRLGSYRSVPYVAEAGRQRDAR